MRRIGFLTGSFAITTFSSGCTPARDEGNTLSSFSDGEGDGSSASSGESGDSGGESSSNTADDSGDSGDDSGSESGGASCGDGVMDPGEECDDGNDDNADGCNNNCQLASCGNGGVDPGEQCDDGNEDDSDACAGCQLAYCGDSHTQAGVEACDDGNDDPTDACIPVFCVEATCGDGYLWDGMEVCDDGNDSDNDVCPTVCEDAYCGDGFWYEGEEECDDGNMDEADGCTFECIALMSEWTFTDTNGDDVAAMALKTFFDSVPAPGMADYIYVAVLGGGTQGSFCATRADWYVSEYKTKGAGAGTSQSGAWNKWYRVGNEQQAWQGPTQQAYTNYFAANCFGAAWDWCVEWGIGNLFLGLFPGSASTESYAQAYTNGSFEITVRLAKARIAACGF